MKRIMKVLALALFVVLGSSLQNKTSAQSYDDYDNDADVSYQTFYDELSPHGRWIDYPEYGYVWSPYEGPDFRPYSTRGHWAWSEDYDWIWVSDYDWGWAPFHYGRWFNDPHYGWLWMPGYEWSPAWVAWRDGGDYYGWAPIRPGINISINFSLGNYYAPDLYWNFAPRRYITSHNIYNHCIDWRRNVTIIQHTTIINNYNYGRNGWRTGPRRYDAERYTGRIEPVRFRASSRPGRSEFRNNELSIYRPRVQSDNRERFSPGKFERADRNTINNDGNTSGSERRFERNNGATERNNNDFRRNQSTVEDRSNNLPNRETNPRFERRDNTIPRQPAENRNTPGTEPRKFERRTDGNPSTNDTRVRPTERPAIEPKNNEDDNNRRRFERKEIDNRPSTNQEIRRPAERNNPNNGNNEFRRIERNPVQPPVQRPEVNTERRQQTPVRTQAEPNKERSREQPRQFERRESNTNGQSNNEGNKNNSRRRF